MRSSGESDPNEDGEDKSGQAQSYHVTGMEPDLQIRGALPAGAEAPGLQGPGQLIGVPQGLEEDRHQQRDVLAQAGQRPPALEIQSAGAPGPGDGGPRPP